MGDAPPASGDAIVDGLMSLFTPVVTKVDEHVRAVQTSQTALLQQIHAVEQELAKFQPPENIPSNLDAHVQKLVDARRKMATVATLLRTTQERVNRLHSNVAKSVARKQVL